MPKQNNNIHDKAFKLALSDPKQARNFLNSYLPSRVLNVLDTSSVKCEKDTFIEKDKREYFADLLFSVGLKGRKENAFVYVLLEHKSYPYPKTLLQLLKYMVAIWDRCFETDKKLPRIIPIVVYHGKSGWHVPKMLSDMFAQIEKLDDFLPDFKAKVINLKTHPDIENKGPHSLRLFLWALKHSFDRDPIEKLFEISESFLILLDKPDPMSYLNVSMTYLADRLGISHEELFKKISDVLGLESDRMELISERIRKQGIAQGVQQGIEQGIAQGVEQGIGQGILYGGIETALEIKFGKDAASLMDKVRKINDPEKLKSILSAIKLAESFDSVKQIVS